MKQDLTGGYCPRCDTVWASPGVCRCAISYQNTKEGIHETGARLNIAPYNSGCSCEECNKAFGAMLDHITYSGDELPTPTFHCAKCGQSTEGFSICLKCNPQTYKTSQDEMAEAVETYKIVGIDKTKMSEEDKLYWDKAKAMFAKDDPVTSGLPAQAVQQPSDELVRLVIAARVVAFQDQSPDAIRELDEASEAFAEIVPWDDEPDGKEKCFVEKDVEIKTTGERSVFETEIWNKAIEAAANVSEINSAANIRKLKR